MNRQEDEKTQNSKSSDYLFVIIAISAAILTIWLRWPTIYRLLTDPNFSAGSGLNIGAL